MAIPSPLRAKKSSISSFAFRTKSEKCSLSIGIFSLLIFNGIIEISD